MLTPFSTGQREDEEEQESTLEEWHLMKFGQSTGQRSDSQSSSSGSSSTESIAIDEDWAGPLSRFTPQKPMLDIFLQRFVDAFSPEVDASSGHAGALRAGAEIRIFSPLISRAYDAVSLTFFGRAVKDTRIEAAGLNLYPKVLRSLQEALQDPERSRSESTLITVTLLLAFESIERTTDAGVLAHVRGAARLIEHRGPENHVQGVEHLLFTELRPYWVNNEQLRKYLVWKYLLTFVWLGWSFPCRSKAQFYEYRRMEECPVVFGHNYQRSTALPH